MSKREVLPEGAVIYTDHQISGKGQRGNYWEDEAGKNILMSLLLKPRKLPIKYQYFLNLIAGLAVLDMLREHLRGEHLTLKWPNDVYVGKRKIAGILIENNLVGGIIDASVVGIGLNVNQEIALPASAISLKEITGKSIDRLSMMDEL